MRSPGIDPTVRVEASSHIDPSVSIGAYTTIGSGVEIATGVSIGEHNTLRGPAVIGRQCRIAHHTVLGTDPQDLKYGGETTFLRVGERNDIREFVTMNRGTVDGGGETRIGNSNMFMAYVHVAHDCRIGDFNIVANAVNMAGHVQIQDHVVVGGMSALHQFVRIGSYAIVGGASAVARDVPPFCMAAGNRAKVIGINRIGLQRKGFDEDDIDRIRLSVRILMNRRWSLEECMERVALRFPESGRISELLEFIRTSRRGTCIR